jgi:hypothetical protein
MSIFDPKLTLAEIARLQWQNRISSASAGGCLEFKHNRARPARTLARVRLLAR